MINDNNHNNKSDRDQDDDDDDLIEFKSKGDNIWINVHHETPAKWTKVSGDIGDVKGKYYSKDQLNLLIKISPFIRFRLMRKSFLKEKVAPLSMMTIFNVENIFY